MEQITALAERIRTLKVVAASMHEGAIHTELIPEIDKILALPERLDGRTVGELEAVARQVREYEQTFDGLGYSLLEQLMPSTSVSPVFRVVRAADRYRQRVRQARGQTVEIPAERKEGQTARQVEIDAHAVDVLTRYSLSIGTPPVTDGMQRLVARTLFGCPVEQLSDYIELLGCDRVQLERLLALLREVVASSTHYCTALEEQRFLDEAAELVNFEGGRLFNRVVITESPERVIQLIARHVFDKVSPGEKTPVEIVEGVDQLDQQLIGRMEAEPNQVFVARVTRIPHGLFSASRWLGVLGRLMLIDSSQRARQCNTTIVYTLFPHVAKTLRDVQTSFAGRPANTQLQLRRVIERFSAADLESIASAIDERLARARDEDLLSATVEQIRTREWVRSDLHDYLVLAKLRRLVRFLAGIAAEGDGAVGPRRAGDELAVEVARDWMRYFYRGLDPERYPAVVVPGGGRGALTLVGEYHRERTRRQVEAFRRERLAGCRERLEQLKQSVRIPDGSTDEIEAAIRQSQLRALPPSQLPASTDASLPEHLARTLLYRAADAAGRLADRTRQRVDRAAFGNLTGGAAALVKRTMSDRGLGALHGRLERVVGDRVGRYDRRLRDALTPLQGLTRQAQRTLANVKGELDPVAVSDIEATLNTIEQDHFYPLLILPRMAWTYGDVFPDKDYPAAATIHVELNDRFEMDPLALLARLEQLRYLFRRFPEIFELYCHSMLLVLNTPHNPTGVVYRRETVLRLLQIASEYGITVVDDNAYHKLVTSVHKAREGDACAAQLYETYRSHFSRPVRMITVGATTKGLQGAGDRTGLVHANVAEVVDYVRDHASASHRLSLYLTKLKLESGLAVKRYTKQIERLAGELLDPTGATTVWQRLGALLEGELSEIGDERFPVAAVETLFEGYERMLRLKQRGGGVQHLSRAASELVGSIKQLRLERRLRGDVQKRLDQTREGLSRIDDGVGYIEPQGGFYCCVRLCDPDDDRNVQPFLEALAAARGVDFTYAGQGYVRMSLGGRIEGDAKSYQRLGALVELFGGLLSRYWSAFDAAGRELEPLERLFCPAGGDPLGAALADLQPLLAAHPRPARPAERRGYSIEPSERGTVYCIEEGRSVADKVFAETDGGCETVEELLGSRSFRVNYRRLLRKVYRDHPRLTELTLEQVENQYGPLACQHAYHDRQLIDDVFRQLLLSLYRSWHGAETVKVLGAQLQAGSHREKMAALQGVNRGINELINELMHAFGIAPRLVDATSTFAVGYEALSGVRPHERLPDYLERIIARSTFAGATAPLDPAPRLTTGAAKRVGDYRYGFIRRDRASSPPTVAPVSDPTASRDRAGAQQPTGDLVRREAPDLAYFRRRLDQLAERIEPRDYVCKAVQVGPFKMLLVIHKACFHLISDELRLFPQIEQVQLSEHLQKLAWEGVLLFGVPAKLMGAHYKSGYVIDRYEGGELLPTAWVAREDATDYVGFLKKSLLTLHNERVKALGGMPVHGAMITITFRNGLRKTLVFSADSGTGKSETITAMMEQMIRGGKLAAELDRIDILAGDMLSLWRGEDEQVYAFGTETGDFLRLTDITDSWKAQFGDLLERGSYSNLDHPKNPRVTIPSICDRRRLLTPTRVNGFFYINNYEPASGSAVEVIEDPHQVLKQILVRGLRENKGTSGDQPSLRAGLELAGEHGLVTRFRHELDQLLHWQTLDHEGQKRTCLAFRDGAGDVYAAREVVRQAFRGRSFERSGERLQIDAVDYDVMRNCFWLHCGGRQPLVLDREVYDRIYQPLVSTFCGNPFVDPPGMHQTLGVFAETMRRAKVHTGVIRTQLARPGYEFTGPAQAADDVIAFLLEDEEVNARYQRNKAKVHQAMQRTYGGVLRAGTNLPVALEGYNLLLLEEHESTHVMFVDGEQPFTLRTPYFDYRPAPTEAAPFVPAIALPEQLEVITDIVENSDYELPLGQLEVELSSYDAVRYWNSLEELTYQVLLCNQVIALGSSETELARFPLEVRKAHHIARRIAEKRPPQLGAEVVSLHHARPAR